MKWLLRLLALLLGAIVVAVVAMKLLIDPNDFKPQITQQVEQATGRKLDIGGDIGLSLLPLGLTLSQVELANAEGFDDPYFARIEALTVKVQLLPLLRKELAVDALSLRGFALNLQVKADGRNNWEDLSRGEPVADADATASAGAEQTPAASSSLAALAVNGIDIADATVQFNDQQNGQLIRLDKFNLATGSIRFDQAFELDFSASATHAQQAQRLAAEIRLRSRVTLAQSLQQFALDGVQLTLRANVPGMLPEPVDLALQANSRIDLAQQLVSVSDARIEVFGLPLQLQANIENWQQGLHISGTLRADDIKPRELAQRLAVELPSMQSAQALTQAALDITFDLQNKQLQLKPLGMSLDASKLKGSVAVNLDTTAVRYQLSLDRINVNDYLPPPADTDTPPAVQPVAASAAEQDLPVPFDLLAGLNIDGRFEIGSLQLMAYRIEQLSLNARARNGVIELDPLTLNVLDGSIRASSVIDTRRRTLQVVQRLQADKLQIASIVNPIVAALIPDQKIDVRGTGDLYAELRTSGLRISTLQQQLDGKAGFAFDDIIVNGLDSEYLARGVIADYLQSKKIAVKPDWRGSYRPKNVTAFDVVKADFDIRKGVARTDNLLLDSKRIEVTGKGNIDLPRQTLDLYTVTDLTPRQLKTTAEKLLDEPLPVRVYGPWAAPQVDVDTAPMQALLANQAKAKVKARVKARTDKKIETKKQQLRDKARDKLKNLLR